MAVHLPLNNGFRALPAAGGSGQAPSRHPKGFP